MEALYLRSQRLHLKPVMLSDLDHIHELYLLPESHKYNTSSIPQNIEETRQLLEQWILEGKGESAKNFVYTINRNEDRQFIGLIAIYLKKEKYRNAEVWFRLNPSQWNKGYATEALRTLITFGFSILGLHRIEGGCAIGNAASGKVLEKAGMTLEAHTRQLLPLATGWSDNYGYAILSLDWKKPAIKEP